MAFNRGCPLLQLPIELRLLIFESALLDGDAITIGSAELVGSQPDVVHRLYGEGRTPFAGLPHRHEPVIESRYNASLLSITNPGFIPLTSVTSCHSKETFAAPHSTRTSLLLVNEQINEELSSHFSKQEERRASLFTSFPHGLHILQTLTSHLLRQAQSVHIAGTYTSRTFNPARAACLGPASPPPPEPRYNGDIPDSAKQLSDLVAACFGPERRHPIVKLEMRIYYPGSDSYSTVWGDDNSPVVVALRNVYNGEVRIEVWRGNKGTGIYLTARPTEERKRLVSTVWRKLEEGRRGEPLPGSWVVDPRWPDWTDDEEIGETPADATVVSSVPVGLADS